MKANELSKYSEEEIINALDDIKCPDCDDGELIYCPDTKKYYCPLCPYSIKLSTMAIKRLGEVEDK